MKVDNTAPASPPSRHVDEEREVETTCENYEKR